MDSTITITWNLPRSKYASLSDGTKILIPSDIRKAFRTLQRRL